MSGRIADCRMARRNNWEGFNGGIDTPIGWFWFISLPDFFPLENGNAGMEIRQNIPDFFGIATRLGVDYPVMVGKENRDNMRFFPRINRTECGEYLDVN